MSKSRNEYLEILNLDSQATDQQIEERFNELFSDFQIRLTNAPTPNLKKLYQKNLQELEDAYAHLISSGKITSKETDLPSSKPVQNNNANNPIANKPQNSNIQTEPTVVAGRRAKNTNTNSSNIATTPKTGISTNIFIVTIVAALALIALTVSLYFEGKKEVEAITEESLKNQDFLKFKDFFKNGKFKVENRTQNTVTLYLTHVTFINNQNQLQEYKFLGTDGNPRPVSKKLEPGKNISLNQYEGPVKWDGSVLSYSMLVFKENSGVPSAVYSGIWLHEWPENKLVISN